MREFRLGLPQFLFTELPSEQDADLPVSSGVKSGTRTSVSPARAQIGE